MLVDTLHVQGRSEDDIIKSIRPSSNMEPFEPMNPTYLDVSDLGRCSTLVSLMYGNPESIHVGWMIHSFDTLIINVMCYVLLVLFFVFLLSSFGLLFMFLSFFCFLFSFSYIFFFLCCSFLHLFHHLLITSLIRYSHSTGISCLSPCHFSMRLQHMESIALHRSFTLHTTSHETTPHPIQQWTRMARHGLGPLCGTTDLRITFTINLCLSTWPDLPIKTNYVSVSLLSSISE